MWEGVGGMREKLEGVHSYVTPVTNSHGPEALNHVKVVISTVIGRSDRYLISKLISCDKGC